MTPATVMAEDVKPLAESGAPIAKDAIDPELVKLGRPRPKVGVVTAAGMVFLCATFLHRLGPDREFASSSTTPKAVSVSQVLAGQVDVDQLISVDAEPVTAHAIRATTAKGTLGLRIAPARGTGDRLWLVASGDPFDPPHTGSFTGRLRRLADLPLADAVRAFAHDHPRPVFAAASAARAGFASSKVATVGGDQVSVDDSARVALDVVDPNVAVVVATLNDRLPDAAAWAAALAKAGVTATPAAGPAATAEVARFEVHTAGAVADTTPKLEAAGLWAARVEPITRHYETSWGALKTSTPAGFALGATTVPDAQLDLVGLYVTRDIPSDAYAVLANEQPETYWYVLPIKLAVALIGLVFLWALVRAVKRDLLAPRAA